MVRTPMQGSDLPACRPRATRVTTAADEASRATSPASRTWAGWLYLDTVIDGNGEPVIGWSMADRLRTDLICYAVTMVTGNVELAPADV